MIQRLRTRATLLLFPRRTAGALAELYLSPSMEEKTMTVK